ncbi:hypothetical protein AOLI_G00120150 [Acnodon oligacanthus]
MCGARGLCMFFIIFVAGTTDSVTFQQISSLFANESDNITIQCSHDDSSLPVTLWYQQKRDSTAMALIGYTYGTNDPKNEDGFKKRRMCGARGLCMFFIIFVAGTTDSVTFQQISSLFANESDNITIQCSHDDSNLPVTLWYQQKRDSTAMALIGYTYGPTDPKNEDGFKKRFHLKRKTDTEGDLIISELLQSDSAVYYCAAKEHSAAYSYDCHTKTSNTKLTETVESIHFPAASNDGSLTQMPWFRQETASTALTLIGYSYSTGEPSYETGFSKQFKMTRQGATSGEPIISDAFAAFARGFFEGHGVLVRRLSSLGDTKSHLLAKTPACVQAHLTWIQLSST